MTTNKTPIKLAELIEETGKLDVMSTFIIDEENNKVVQYNKYFDALEVEKLITELFKDMQYAVSKEYDFFNTEEQLVKYELFLIIKYFSHFKHEIGETYEQKIQAMEALMRLGLFDMFFDEIFDEEQVFNVLDKINAVAEKAIRTVDELEVDAQEISDKVVKPKTKPKAKAKTK